MSPASALLILATYTGLTSSQAEVLFTVACGMQSVSVAGFGSSTQDICRSSKYTSIIYGLTSVPAVLLGSGSVYLAGVVLDVFNDWNVIFGATSVVYCLGAVYYTLFYKADKLFD